jgi:hypothetical protein
VLTESDEALRAGVSFGREFNRFRTWLRKVHCPSFEYIVVEHKQGVPSKATQQLRRNWHILSYGSDRLPVLAMRDYWRSHYLSTVTGMAEVADIGKAVKYLAGYLSDSDKFIRSWHSQGWVFRGWVSTSRQYRKSFADYPPANSLAELSLMSPSLRAGELDWLLNTGDLSSYFQGGTDV